MKTKRNYILIIILVFLSSTQLMSQDISLTVDSLQNKFTKSIKISKFDLSNKKLTLSCSFSKKDLGFVNLCKNNNIYIGSDTRFSPTSSASITTLNDSISLLTLEFTNYIDTIDQINLFSDCDTCFYFKGIRLNRLYDVIALENGSIIKALIIEDGVWLIKYQKFGFVNEGVFSIPKDQILCIKYRDQQDKKPDLQNNNVEIQPAPQFDLIVMKNKQEIKSVIQEVGVSEVKFKRANYINGPVFSVLKKDIFFIKYKNGQTDTLNFIENKPSMQDESDNFNRKVNTLDYGGPFSYGFCLGGAGLIGIPLRFYISQLLALDLNVGLKPAIATVNNESQIDINIFYSGGFDFYFLKKYNPYKNQVKMNGFFIKGGGSYGSRFNEFFGAFGWASERFKTENRSFTIQLGLGIIQLQDKDYNKYSSSPYQQINLKQYTENALIFWKFGWNFF